MKNNAISLHNSGLCMSVYLGNKDGKSPKQEINDPIVIAQGGRKVKFRGGSRD